MAGKPPLPLNFSANSTAPIYEIDPLWFRIDKYASSVITLLMNFALMYLLKFRSPQMLKSYANVLFAHCVSDLLYEAVFFLTSVRCIPLNGRFYFVVGGLLEPRSDLEAQRWVLLYFWISVFVPIGLVNVDFVCRYQIICLNKKFTMQHVMKFVVGVYAASFAYTLLFTVPGYECVRYGHLLTQQEIDYVYQTYDYAASGRRAWFGVISILSAREATLLSIVNVVITIDYTVIAVIAHRIYAKVKNDMTHDRKVQKLNLQVLLAMLMQASAPSFLFVPTLICITKVMLGADMPTLYHTSVCFFVSWFRPIATILLISPYRRAFLQMIGLKPKTVGPSTTNMTAGESSIVTKRSKLTG